MSDQPFCHACQKDFNTLEQLSAHEGEQTHLSKLKSVHGGFSHDNTDFTFKQEYSGQPYSIMSSNSSFMLNSNLPSYETYHENVPALSLRDKSVTTPFNEVSNSGFNNMSKTEPRIQQEFGGRTSNLDTSHHSHPQNEEREYVYDKLTQKGKCFLCNVIFSSYKQAEDHILGKGHRQKKASLDRNLIRTSVVSPVSASHGAGAVSPSFTRQVGGSSPFQSGTKNFQGNNSDILMCRICEVPFSSTYNMEQHFAGEKHRKMIKKKGLSPVLNEKQNLGVGVQETEKKELMARQTSHSFMNDLSPTDKMMSSGTCRDKSVTPENLASNLQRRVVMTNESRTSPVKYERTLSDNLSENHDKMTPLKDKHMIVSEFGPLGMSTMSASSETLPSITDNTHQPLYSWVKDNSSPRDSQQSAKTYDYQLGSVSTTTIATPDSHNLVNSNAVRQIEGDTPSLNQLPNRSLPAYSAPRQSHNEYDFDGDKGTCHVCSVELTSWKLAQQHINGQPHKKKLERWQRMSVQDIPRIDANATVVGVSSQIVVGSNAKDRNSPAMGSQHPNWSSKGYYHFNGSKGFCQACSTELTSVSQANQHINGKPHRRNVQRMQTSEQGVQYPLYCNVCEKPFTGQESAADHFLSEKHKRLADIFNSESTQVIEVYDHGRKLLHNGRIIFFCHVCRKVLDTKEQLDIHSRAPHHLAELESSQNAMRQVSPFTPDTSGQVSIFPTSVAAQNNQGSENVDSPLFAHDSKRSSLDSLEQIKELLTFGENPVVNVESMRGKSDGANLDCQQQSVRHQDAFDNSDLATNKLGLARGFRNETDTPNYHQGLAGEQVGNFIISRDEFMRQSANKISPDSNRSAFIFRPIPQRASNSGREYSSGHGNGGNGNMGLSNRSNTGTDASGVLSRTRSKERHGAPDDDEGHGSLVSSRDGDEFSCFSGNVRVGPKGSVNQVSGRDRTQRRTVNLEGGVDQDDSSSEEGDDMLMNITGEKEILANRESQTEQILAFSRNAESTGVRKKYFCDLCKRQMNAKKSWKDHLEGKLHQWNLSNLKPQFQLRDPIVKTCSDRDSGSRAFDLIRSCPRKYQVKLMEKALGSDCVVYLPTGTGKTLVSVLTIGMMLEKNPTRPVIFLVDKVLLVIQQARYIVTEFENRRFKRASLQRTEDGNVQIEERKLNLAFVCGGLLHTHNAPIWQHDIIVTTVAYCINMLNNGVILWEDFSLAVLDEVHHCVKKHPFHQLINTYHHGIPDPEKRPKLLGLTASPAGKSTVEATYEMLQSLLRGLGGARIAFVDKDCQDELKSYQSNPHLRQFCVPMTDKEQHFQVQCINYFLHCYIQLAPLATNLRDNLDPPCSYFRQLLTGSAAEESLNEVTRLLVRDAAPLTEIMPFILKAECSEDVEEATKLTFKSLHSHALKIVVLIADIPTGIDFDDLKKDFIDTDDDNSIFHDVKKLGLPCDIFYKQILNFEEEEGCIEPAMIGKLMQILQDPSYINWGQPDSMALVLVRQRKNAKSLARKLKHKSFVDNNDLRVTHLVGHGKGAQDGGMKVKDQKKRLDNRYNILVATSIAEEGVDIHTLELVVSMNPPSNVTALVQMRGRARKKGSHFVILCSNEEEMRKLEELQLHEKNMMEAARKCVEGE